MNDIQVAKTQAAWYAWGQIDSGNYVGLPLDVSEFSDSYMESYKAYINGDSGYLESIQGQWREYVSLKRVR